MWKQLGVAANWEYMYQMGECESRFGVSRPQFFGIICCYEVGRPDNEFGVITKDG